MLFYLLTAFSSLLLMRWSLRELDFFLLALSFPIIYYSRLISSEYLLPRRMLFSLSHCPADMRPSGISHQLPSFTTAASHRLIAVRCIIILGRCWAIFGFGLSWIWRYPGSSSDWGYGFLFWSCRSGWSWFLPVETYMLFGSLNSIEKLKLYIQISYHIICTRSYTFNASFASIDRQIDKIKYKM